MRLAVHNVCVLLVVCLAMLESVDGGRFRFRPKKCKKPIPQDLVEKPFKVIPERRRIVGDCFADINRCPTGSCFLRNEVTRRRLSCRRMSVVCPVYGVINPVTTSDTVDCGPFGSLDIERVTSCVCENDPGIEVNLAVVDSANDDTPLSGISVTVNDDELGVTTIDGEFTTTVPSQTKRVVISALDNSVNYISTVKVVDIPIGTRGPFYVIVELLKTAEPVSIDSTLEQQLSISNNPSDPTAGVASITIQPDSFKNQDDSPYSGEVLASVNVIDISDPNVEDEIPGQFLTIESGITRPLISDAIFAFTFRDPSDNLLEVDSVTIDVRKDMMLWTLNSAGLWDLLLDTGTGRKKRQTSLDQFTVNIQNAQWVNVVKIPDAPDCYFKARVFQSDGTTEITTSTTTTFQTQVLGFITNVTPNQRLRMYTPSTRSPANTCFSVRCPAVVNNNTLAGFINMTSFETAIVGGVNIPVVQFLPAKTLAQYADFQDALNAIRYDRAPNNVDVFANVISNPTGPFYTDIALCENSAVTEPAFHFTKPPLPSYEPIPEGTDLCTARLAFAFRQFNEDMFTNLALPNVTAVSVWSADGASFFYTDNAVIDFSTLTGNARFLSVCITYRCSDADSNTSVYLTINSPNITITVPTNQIDTASNETVVVPAMSCRGECVGNFCSSGDFSSSFIAPITMESGPAFYPSTNNKCTQETSQEMFAVSLYCSKGKRQIKGTDRANTQRGIDNGKPFRQTLG